MIRIKNTATLLLVNILEWYDYSVNLYFSSEILKHFFTPISHLSHALFTYLMVFLTIVVRPLGGYVLSWVGDMSSNEKSLRIAFCLMLVPTLCVGILPAFEYWGYAAPLIYVLLRMLQGMSAGAQYTSTLNQLATQATKHRGGFQVSFGFVSSMVGYLVATVVCFLCLHYLHPWMSTWAWRVPFLLSALAFCFMPSFFKLLQASEVSVKTCPASTIKLRQIPLAWYVRGVSFAGLGGIIYYTVFVYLFNFEEAVNSLVTIKDSMLINGVNIVFLCFLVPFFSYLSDIYGRKLIMRISACGFICLAPVLLMGFAQLPWPGIYGVNFLFVALASAFIGPITVVYTELAPQGCRQRFSALTYNLGTVFIGATAPLMVVGLSHIVHKVQALAFYWVLTGVLSLLVLLGPVHAKDMFKNQT